MHLSKQITIGLFKHITAVNLKNVETLDVGAHILASNSGF